MSGGRTLILLAAAPGEADPPAVEEFLRLAVGLLAGGHSLQALALHRLGPLSESAEPYLEALGEDGLSFEPDALASGGLRAAVLGCHNLLRLAACDRAATPDLLLIDDTYLAAVSDERLLTDLRAAGQVIRVR